MLMASVGKANSTKPCHCWQEAVADGIDLSFWDIISKHETQLSEYKESLDSSSKTGQELSPDSKSKLKTRS